MRIIFLMGLVIAGCAGQAIEGEDEDVPVGPVGPFTPYDYDEELQGRFIIGSVPDGYTDATLGQPYVSFGRKVTNRTTDYVKVTNGQLVLTSANGNPKAGTLEGAQLL